MKRRLSLAIALLHEPKLLVLDEPTVGLDPLQRQELWSAFHDLANSGSALLVTTHVMDEAARCDSLVMLHDKQVIASGTPEALMKRTGDATLEESFLHFQQLAKEPLAKEPLAKEPLVQESLAKDGDND
jgi:ABC-2 type transport system ATP-binding protein